MLLFERFERHRKDRIELPHLEMAEEASGQVGRKARTVVKGLPPKSWRRSWMIRSGFPFARNGSLCLQDVLDDAFARSHHNAFEDLLEGFLGLFSIGPRASTTRFDPAKRRLVRR
jgi:hypothetical protein